MKKFLLILVLAFSFSLATHAQDSKDKVKETSTMPQKVHNTFSKHKKHDGYKTKHKHHGITHKKKVDYKKGTVKAKKDD